MLAKDDPAAKGGNERRGYPSKEIQCPIIIVIIINIIIIIIIIIIHRKK